MYVCVWLVLGDWLMVDGCLLFCDYVFCMFDGRNG